MTEFGFDRSLRLLSAGDYRPVFNQAELKVSVAEILILARPNNSQRARLGLVVAKKHVKLAVGRNRIKRIARESFRLQQQCLAGLDIVFLARRGIGELDNRALRYTIDQLWLKLAKRAKKKG